MSEVIQLEVHLKPSWWRRALHLPRRPVCFSTDQMTRAEAREYVDALQQQWPDVAIALIGSDWHELREPADGTRGSWRQRDLPG